MIVVWYYLVSHLLAPATQPRSMLPPDFRIGRHLGVDAVTAMKLQTDSYELTINNLILWCGAKKWFVFFFISMLDGVS
jgi:hypothetical protein